MKDENAPKANNQPKKRTGRPRKFTPEVAKAICKQLSLGRSLRKVCKDPGMPSLTSVMDWLQGDQAFSAQYARAKRIGLELHVDEIIDLADTADGENAHAVRLQVDTRKWLASKLLPKLYGDRVSVDAEVLHEDRPTDLVELAKDICFVLNLAADEQQKREVEKLPLMLPAPTVIEPPAAEPQSVDDDADARERRRREQEDAIEEARMGRREERAHRQANAEFIGMPRSYGPHRFRRRY